MTTNSGPDSIGHTFLTLLGSSFWTNLARAGDAAAAAAAVKRARKTLAREGELLGLKLISQDLRSAHEDCGMLLQCRVRASGIGKSWDCVDINQHDIDT